jgi:hypothetical protein
MMDLTLTMKATISKRIMAMKTRCCNLYPEHSIMNILKAVTFVQNKNMKIGESMPREPKNCIQKTKKA